MSLEIEEGATTKVVKYNNEVLFEGEILDLELWGKIKKMLLDIQFLIERIEKRSEKRLESYYGFTKSVLDLVELYKGFI